MTSRVPQPSPPASDSRPHDEPWPAMTWPPAPDVRLCGDVVELRPARPERDAEELFRALDHEAVWAHVAGRPGHVGEQATRLRERIQSGWLPWVTHLRVAHAGLATGTCVGTTSYLDVSAPDARLEVGATAYTPAAWGTAVNPDTKLVLLRHAFEVLGAGRVQLKTDVRNIRSQQAIARLGARYEGTLRRYQRRADGTVRDTAVFSVVAEDWPAVRAGLQSRIASTLGPVTPRR